MQITAPSPIIYLPENLWSLFTKPGRELLVRVLNIEGKTLDLELGGEKFQARIGGTINPEDFKIGETIRVKVIKTGNPIILQVISEEKEASDLKLFYLVTKEFEKEVTKDISLRKDLNLLATFVNEIIKKEKKEITDKSLKKLFGDKIKNLKVIYQQDKIVLPFIFNDERSWGYLELGAPEERKGRVKLFYLKFYFEYLGLVECYISYLEKEIYIEFYFVNQEAYKIAKKEYKNLENILVSQKIHCKIEVNMEEISPGYLLEKRG
ncbi:hypothetical protein [Thermodesulfobacterium hydrogeniphilum]|uniref:hypothetical protein n=1 Tax=Thermodesulfobacterium hydrogeniphilum TaxID=161156 RepID=UPI00056F3FD9|nr:hypothetical protein [Thermodesulfobacterium hydrogeniphilum]